MTRTRLEPGPDHPITVAAEGTRVVVRIGQTVIADTANCADPAGVDLPAGLLRADGRRRPGGAASQRHLDLLPVQGRGVLLRRRHAPRARSRTSCGFTPQPYDAVDAIDGHVAFYPDKVELTVG